MTSFDFIYVLQWWAVLFLIGLGFLPLTILIFTDFFDKGYLFAKILGIGILSYFVYIYGLIRIVPFTQINSIIIFLVLCGISIYLIPIRWRVVFLLKKAWKIFLLEEIFFLSALLFWSYIHGFNPDIHGLEKYMDYGFVNSILRGEFFPPKDMWFTPEYINYYYYGHYITALITKISGLTPAICFNLMLSTIFAFCLTSTFSIGANLFAFSRKKDQVKKYWKKLIITGLLTAFLATLGGNLHILYAFFKPYQVDNPKPLWELAFAPFDFPNSYWYPNATRYIYHTIHEFPIYSWVVADLHGHVMDIPFVLTFIAFCIVIFMKLAPTGENEIKDERWLNSWINTQRFRNFRQNFGIHPLAIVMAGFLLAIMYMTNAWDGAIYIMLITLVIGCTLWISTKEFSFKKISNFLVRLFVSVSLIITSFLVFTFPYNYFFKPFVSGIGILCSPDFLIKAGRIGPFIFEANHCQHSYWWELLMLYGFFYFFIFAFIIYLFWTKKIRPSDIFILLLIALGTTLILIPEFIYIKDIYPAHYRANTMFKLVFQSFIMLSIVSAYVISKISQSKIRLIFLPITMFLIIPIMTYPYLAINSYYGDLKTYKGLFGTNYLNNTYPDDYAGILWLNSYVKGQPVILEAQGDSYTDYERVSANTGLPTVLGWTVHEWLWRGDYSIPAPRINEVAQMYESEDLGLTRKLLTKYDVKYVFIGTLERQKYPKLNSQKFESLGKKVFQKQETKIYEILK